MTPRNEEYTAWELEVAERLAKIEAAVSPLAEWPEVCEEHRAAVVETAKDEAKEAAEDALADITSKLDRIRVLVIVVALVELGTKGIPMIWGALAP